MAPPNTRRAADSLIAFGSSLAADTPPIRRIRLSATVFREGNLRVFFFSREEARMHVHVQSGESEAKIWMEPKIELDENLRVPRGTSLVKFSI
jgi:hypothetical protein